MVNEVKCLNGRRSWLLNNLMEIGFNEPKGLHTWWWFLIFMATVWLNIHWHVAQTWNIQHQIGMLVIEFYISSFEQQKLLEITIPKGNITFNLVQWVLHEMYIRLNAYLGAITDKFRISRKRTKLEWGTKLNF